MTLGEQSVLIGCAMAGVALATVVGVLVEVPVMLILVRIANNSIKELPQ